MPFPLTYRGKIAFPLKTNPDTAVKQFSEDAAYKISKAFYYDADVSVSATDDKLVVEYTVKYKKPLIITSLMVLVFFGVYFSTWELANPPGLPQTWGRSGMRKPPSITEMITVMGVYWLWFVGGNYVAVAVHLRSLLKDTWRRMILPPDDNKDVT